MSLFIAALTSSIFSNSVGSPTIRAAFLQISFIKDFFFLNYYLIQNFKSYRMISNFFLRFSFKNYLRFFPFKNSLFYIRIRAFKFLPDILNDFSQSLNAAHNLTLLTISDPHDFGERLKPFSGNLKGCNLDKFLDSA